MSILIKDMGMPKNCDECFFVGRGFPDWCSLPQISKDEDEIDDTNNRPDWCPLEEVPETHEKRTETHSCDYINRKDAIDAHYEYCNKHPDAGFPVWSLKILENLPSAQPERLTDDDFETIRIHLNSYKEKLCNQQRWEEANEYQRIIDRFMAFASAQPDLGKYEYHYDHTDCIWYRPEARNRCPVTCAQYRDGWNDAMNYIFRDGKGYRPYRRGEQYEG